METPLATVIIPVYRVEGYLTACIESVLGQAYQNLQVVLVDDGSPDRCGAICDAYAEKDARVQVIHKENGGLGSARNAGLDAAQGKYIYFVDSDDLAAENLVSESLPLMERGGYDLCIWGKELLENGASHYSGRWSAKTFRFRGLEEQTRFLCRWGLTYRLGYEAWSRVFRRAVIEEHHLRFGNEREIFAEDLDFTLRYMAYCHTVRYIPRPLYRYRIREGSLMRTKARREQAVKLLHMLRLQERDLSGQELFQRFYLFAGVVLTTFLGEPPAGQAPEGHIAEIASCFRAAEAWEFLVREAQLAAGDRKGIRRACGRRLGGLVCAFYQYILDPDPVAYSRAARIQRWYIWLRTWKNRLVHPGGGAP